jgi:hypothetical protein
MDKKQSRRQFLRTSAGFSVILLSPGIWSCQTPKNEKQKYDFRTYKSDGQLAPVTIVTPEDGDFVHTYFDVTPFSPSGRYMVTSKLPFQDHLPELGVTAEVCVIDLKEQTIETVYSTKTWGFQTGTNAQWGKSDRYVYTNDLIDGKAVMIQIDLENGETKAFSSSMYNIARNGEYGIGFPLELLNATQQGYGMPSPEVDNPTTLTEEAHKDEGLWRTNLKTGKSELLYSLYDIASNVPEPMPKPGGTFYFWHSKYNRQCTRIMQVLRCIYHGFDGGSDRNAMLFTTDADGKNIKFTQHDPVWAYPTGGHPNWHPDGEHIIRNMYYNDLRLVCQFKYDGSDFKPLSETFKGIGHPSMESSGRYLITDNRIHKNDGTATIELLLLDTHTDQTVKICTAPTVYKNNFKGAMGALRLDGHPSWSRDYKKVSLQATSNGRRQLYVVDMSELIS